MNRNILLSVLGVIISLFMVGCANKDQYSGKAKDTIDDEIKACAADFGYTVTKDKPDYPVDYENFIIETNNDLQYIDLMYDIKTYNNVTITYYVDNKNDYDLDFFLELTNTLAEKKVTKEELIEFMNSDPEKYPPGKYGYSKSSDEKVKKVKSTFWQDWELIYSELKDGTSTLYFGGDIE